MHSTNLLLSPRNVWNWDAYIKFSLKWRHDFRFLQKRNTFLYTRWELLSSSIDSLLKTSCDWLKWFFLWVHPCIWQFPGTEPTHWMRGQRSWASHESRPMMKVNQIDPPWPAFSIGADPLRLSIIFNNIRAVSARGFSVIDAGDRCA